MIMSLARFYIVEHKHGWCVSIDGEMTPPCPTKSEAASLAIKAAMALTESGHQAEIYVDGDELSTVPFWCSGGVPVIH
jgi:hypothetical protein